jgi:curved DNA-binding protein CbpA
MSRRPFSTLGLKPFLFASDADRSQIQTQYIRLSRQFHPDRAPAGEARTQAEALSARINRDAALVRDFWKLVEEVAHPTLEHGAQNETPPPARGGPPPDLAEEYFEIQEAIADGSPEARSQINAFTAKIESRLVQSEKAVIDFAKRFPYSGLGDGDEPWTSSDLEQLRALLRTLRFDRSFLRDISAKFPL